MIAKGVLPDFQEFLLSHKLAPEKHVLFLAVWVSRFLAFSNGKGQQDIGLTVTEFLNAGGCREQQECRNDYGIYACAKKYVERSSEST